MANLTAADLIFSEQANHNFSKILGDLKRSNLSITNRLKSIRQDANFVDEVVSTFQRPLVANERCGSWYVDPKRKAASAYFKSTDGHTGQWKFSTRRLNLHLVPLISSHDGCIIVDSTRRGKGLSSWPATMVGMMLTAQTAIPDALSKTVPVWCCVLNRVLFPDETALHDLYVPSGAVSSSEHGQILAKIPAFVQSFHRLDIDVPALRSQIRKPLRPVWITRETPLSLSKDISGSFHPVICCTASRRVAGTELSEGGYIQGAADDTENWAVGLTPAVFWTNIDLLLAEPEAELPKVIRDLLSRSEPPDVAVGVPTRLTDSLYVGSLRDSTGAAPDSGFCHVILWPGPPPCSETRSASPLLLDVVIGKHKTASRNLRQELPRICSFIWQYLNKISPSSTLTEQRRVLISCETGKDISIGVALALLCYCFDDGGSLKQAQNFEETFTKDGIRTRLGKIMTAMPEANPNRGTLQSVNSFLMSRPG